MVAARIGHGGLRMASRETMTSVYLLSIDFYAIKVSIWDTAKW